MSHAAALLNASHGHAQKRARPLLGTLVEISGSGASQHAIGSAIDQAFDAVASIHALMSYHDPASDVSRLNRMGAGTMAVHPHTWQVLEMARALATVSQGLFDISIVPTLVHHGYLPRHTGFPQPAAGANWQHIELLPYHQVRLTQALHLDLGGIAKGYATDCAIRALREAGAVSGRVNAGGDLGLFGETPETIHVRHPHAPTQLLPLCQLQNGAVATSSSYYTRRQVNGRMVSPLINTRTGQPCTESRSVSVLADSCMLADALTKVVFSHPEQALAVLTHFGAHAIIIDALPEASPNYRVRASEAGHWREIPMDLPGAPTP